MDWIAAKTEYITSDIGKRPLARKYGVHPSLVQRRATKEHWDDAREAYKTKTEQKVEEKITEAVLDIAVMKTDTEKFLWMATRRAAERLAELEDLDTNDLRRIVQCYVDMAGLPDQSADSEAAHEQLIEAIREAADREDN